jgi:hypothetical protein
MFAERHWQDIDNKKKLVLDYAERNGFDPFVLANWDGIQIERFLSVKVHSLDRVQKIVNYSIFKMK